MSLAAIHHPPLVARRRPLIRPWAVAGPILILFLCLPMLRPLRHAGELPAEEEQLISMVRQNLTGHLYVADSPPMSLQSLTEPSPTFALVLSGPAWLMQKMGFDFTDNLPLMSYMLIALCVTLPVALSAGFIYRMGRLFELSRPQRAALGLLCVTASGLIAYSTTLSAPALSAAMLIMAAAATLQPLRASNAKRGVCWSILAGALAMLAATLDPSALPVVVLMPLVFLAWRVGWGFRLAAVALFLVGTIAPVWLHRSLHGKPTPGPLAELAQQPGIFTIDDVSGDVESGWAPWLEYHNRRLVTATIGTHGILSHFPLLAAGAAGVLMMMHRNWPEAIKWLAGATLLGGTAAVLAIVISRISFDHAAYATRWFIAFSPLLLFWFGAWLRKPHGRVAWTVVTIAATFSMTVAMIGAARPQPPAGYRGYTAKAALQELIQPTDVQRVAGDWR